MIKLLSTVKYKLSKKDFDIIVEKTSGYSSADLTAYVKDVAMAPLREIPPDKILQLKT